MKIVTVEQMRQIEQECARGGLPTGTLMENAGRAVAEAVRRILGDVTSRDILVLVGPGNNGGDGLVAGRYLRGWGAGVSLYLLAGRPPDDHNLTVAREHGIPVIEVTEDNGLSRFQELLSSANVVVDAVFGTGKSRAISGVFATAIQRLNEDKKRRPDLRIVAVDVPSGLDADTGAVDPVCPSADNTIALGFPKLGLFNFPGAERAGRIEVADIGIPVHLGEHISADLITDGLVRSLLAPRPIVANKGTFGRALVVAGSSNYVGAAHLACSGAMRVGAGLVTSATAASLHPILAGKLTEVTHLPLPESSPGVLGPDALGIVRQRLDEYDALLVGCGLGQSESTEKFVKGLLLGVPKLKVHLVVDADGLNILSKIGRWWRRLPDDAILTPHPGEMARLTGMTVEAIQSQRLEVTRQMSREWHKTVVLKGAYTVIAGPDGRVMVSPFANAGLASAGTGDVLAGAIAGLLAQGLPPFEAAVAGVYIHGKAGEKVSDRLGDAGMIASDLLPALPLAIRSIKEHRSAG